VSDWRWEYDPDEESVITGLPSSVVAEVEQIAAELVIVNSLDYLGGTDYQGMGPGMRTVTRPHLIVWYTAYPRLELVCLVRVQHLG
jgi:hypothetical protein